jgi:ABC-type multidrug transport system ATPase subunit/pSer/pThr/pTyr-binding forkhead associated (FHA) protein/actin-like ATPase involved in cell morphogenesis
VGYSLGVDLGTTFVAAAMSNGRQPEMVTLGGRAVVMPSAVYLAEDGRLLCGEPAVRQAVTNPGRVAQGFKRRLGDPTPLRIGEETRSATDLLSALLSEVLRVVAETEGEAPERVLLTHPANWGPFRRGVFEDVSIGAGLTDTLTVSEPEAAAAHYAVSKNLTEGQVVAVYDLGGGTFDVTVLRAHPDQVEILGVPEGIERLGGIDFDAALFNHLDHVSKGALTALDPKHPRAAVALARVRQDCVLAKESLSVDSEAVIPVFLPDRNFDVTVTRTQFEDLIRAHVESSIGALERTLRSAQVSPADLDAVLLVGGSSRIPLVTRMLTETVGRPVVVDTHPKYAVALGAAGLAAKAAPRHAPLAQPVAAAAPVKPAAEPANLPQPPKPPAAAQLPQPPAAAKPPKPAKLPQPPAIAKPPVAAKPPEPPRPPEPRKPPAPAEPVKLAEPVRQDPHVTSVPPARPRQRPADPPVRTNTPPALHLMTGGRRIEVPANAPFVIGRGDDVQLNLDNPRVSRHHAVLESTDGGWTFTDASRNGSFLDGQQIIQVQVNRNLTLFLGGKDDGAKIQLSPDTARAPAACLRPDPEMVSRVTRQGQLSAVHNLNVGRLRIGRLPENDVVLDDLLVSRRHAEMLRTPAGWQLTDLGSGNGTFVNGRRVNSAPITPRDVIGIGHSLLQLDGERLVECVDQGDNAFEARGITVITDNGTTLLHEVGFALSGKALLAVVGPSGAGKSTLLYALVGSRPAQRGEVRYAERSLYDDYDELRHRIALVPQDDVLHTQLTVEDALGYAAELRFPADTSPYDRYTRIREVIAELGLTEHAHKKVIQLSGGQRKRTSVALELLTKPSLLFLDEPTSGLDPGMDRSVMQTLRSLADDDRTVVVVTHNVANLEVCDRLLLLAKGGWLAYFGPPAEALDYFGERDYADIFLRLDGTPSEVWARKFRDSPQYQRYLGGLEHRPPVPAFPHHAPARPPRQQGPLTQLGVLARRYLAVIGADRGYLGFLAALPIVLSLLARAVPGDAGLSILAATANATSPDPQPRQLLLVLIIGATLMGAAAAIRELVKERTIYQRERSVGLSIGAYLASKVLVLSTVVTVQITLFTMLSLLGTNAPDDPLVLGGGHLEVFVAVLAAGLTTMLIGLAISAAIKNADQGMPLLVLMVMAQLVFSGGLFAVADRPGLEQLAWLAPSRWAYAMTAATADLSKLNAPGGTPDPLWEHTGSTWFAALAVLAAMSVVLTGVIAYLLSRLDPKRRG